MSLSKKITVAALVLGVVASGAAFAANESLGSIESQVTSQLREGKKPVDVARTLIAAKTDLAVIATALVNAGLTPSAAVAAIIDAGGDPAAATAAVIAAAGAKSAKSVVTAANNHAPGHSDQIASAAIAAGADPTDALPATAAGPAAGDTGAPGINGGNTGAPVLVSPSFGGSGGGAASRS